MKIAATRFLAGSALLLAAGLPAAASAQEPLAVVVRPVEAAIQAPFDLLGIPTGPAPVGAYDPGPVQRHTLGYTPEGHPIVRASVLKHTGPRYVNPPDADWSNPIVMRRGAIVPGYVPSTPVENISASGQDTGRYYSYFDTRRGRAVVFDPDTREVVRVIR